MSTFVLRLKGGLGNQLFIYYFGQYITQEFDLKIHYFIDNNSIRSLEDIIEIDLPRYVIFRERVLQKFNYLSRKYNLKRLDYIYKNSFICEDIDVLEKIAGLSSLKKPKLIFLDGYYQDFYYYDSLISRTKLQISNPSPWFVETKRKVEELRPIVLHVRIGDYLTNQNWLGGIISEKYYEKALICMRKSLQHQPIWVFSDDFIRAKLLLQNIGFTSLNFIESSENKHPVEVLEIMSMGSGLVMSNSTFSLWAAKLSKNTNFIIAPDPFLKNELQSPRNFPGAWSKMQSEWLTHSEVISLKLK